METVQHDVAHNQGQDENQADVIWSKKTIFIALKSHREREPEALEDQDHKHINVTVIKDKQ